MKNTLGGQFQGTYASSASQIFRHSGITLISETTFATNPVTDKPRDGTITNEL
jgi:hypothetical protein